MGTEGLAATVVNRFHSGKRHDFPCSTFSLSISARSQGGFAYSVSLYNQHRLGFTFIQYLYWLSNAVGFLLLNTSKYYTVSDSVYLDKIPFALEYKEHCMSKRRYGLLCGSSSSSCGGLQPLAKVIYSNFYRLVFYRRSPDMTYTRAAEAGQHFFFPLVWDNIYTLHSKIYILHCNIYTLYCNIYISHYNTYTLHNDKTVIFTLLTVISTLYTLISTLQTVISTLNTLISTLHTVISTLYTVTSTLPTVISTLQTVIYTL